MRAGKLDTPIKITLPRFGNPDDSGAVQPIDYNNIVYQDDDICDEPEVVYTRAQVIQATTESFLRGDGAGESGAVAFRIRFVDGITALHLVTCGSVTYRIIEVKEIGRRVGLELRCELSRL